MLFTINHIKWTEIKLKEICIHKKIGYHKYDVIMASWTERFEVKSFKLDWRLMLKAMEIFH